MTVRVHMLRHSKGQSSPDMVRWSTREREGKRTGWMGAWYLSSTTNCTAGAEMGYWLSNRNMRANFSPYIRVWFRSWRCPVRWS